MADLAPINTHAAMDHGALLTMDRKRFSASPSTFPHVADLAERALARGIGAVWLLDGSGVGTPDTAFCSPRDGYNVFVPQARNPRSCVVRREGEYRHVYLYWLDGKSPWPWRVLSGADDVLDAVHAYWRLLRSIPNTSPAQNGLDLLYESIGHKDILADNVAVPSLPEPRDALWLRPFDPERTPYLHKYDTNAAYLAVAATQSFGCGEYVEIEGEPSIGTEKLYGAWHVFAQAGSSPYRGTDLPSPWPVTKHRDTFQGWCYTPQLKLARAMGWTVTVNRGYVWPDRHQIMRAWAEKLWTARQAAPAGPVRDAVKAMYVQTFGRMGMHYSDGPQPWYARPHWHGWIMSECARKQLAATDAILRHSGQMPVCIETDALVYASDSPDPALLRLPRGPNVASILERSDGLGGYKHGGSVTSPDLVRALAEAAAKGGKPADWMGSFRGAVRAESAVLA